jgi:hypothetical protein
MAFAVTRGQRFQLVRDHGNEPGASNRAFHPDGTQHDDGSVTLHPFPDGFPLRAGATGTVVAIVAAEDEGAGNHEEDHVVLSFDVDEPRSHTRLVSFTEAQLAELFEEVE